MKQEFIIQGKHSTLTLFFAGWGMDASPFRYTKSKHDLCICYDYRTLEGFHPELFKGYKQIRLVGWSMGVWIATQVISLHTMLPLSETIAINGTLYPVNDELGIPEAIFNGTLNGLNERNLHKFNLRMCGSAESFKIFQQATSAREIKELKEELAAIGEMQSFLPLPSFTWNKAIIGKNDRIFRYKNQLEAWKLQTDTEVIETEAAHYDASLFSHYLTNE